MTRARVPGGYGSGAPSHLGLGHPLRSTPAAHAAGSALVPPIDTAHGECYRFRTLFDIVES